MLALPRMPIHPGLLQVDETGALFVSSDDKRVGNPAGRDRAAPQLCDRVSSQKSAFGVNPRGAAKRKESPMESRTERRFGMLTGLVFLLAASASAENPIIQTKFTADPAPIVWKDTNHGRACWFCPARRVVGRGRAGV